MGSPISIETTALTEADEALVEQATTVTKRAFTPDRWGGAHMVGAALQTAKGEVFTGVSLPASVGRVSMCAEPVAIGAAIAAGVHDFETIVAVRHPLPDEDRDFEVVAACGACRELIADYGNETEIIVPRDQGLRKAQAIDLLPTRHW